MSRDELIRFIQEHEADPGDDVVLAWNELASREFFDWPGYSDVGAFLSESKQRITHIREQRAASQEEVERNLVEFYENVANGVVTHGTAKTV